MIRTVALLQMLVAWALPLPALAAGHSTTVFAAAPPTCTAVQLTATIFWQGATGSLAGPILLTNRGHAPCSLTGKPNVALRGDGQNLPVQRVSIGSSDLQMPVQHLVLIPGARADVQLQWLNWCGRSFPGGVRPVIRIDHTTVRPKWQGPARLGVATARCDAPDAPSLLYVGPYEPFDDPLAWTVDTYYDAIADGHLTSAYHQLALAGRPAYQRFVLGYRGTTRVVLDLLAAPGYQIRRGQDTYSCIAIHLTADQRDGLIERYGGWYMAEEDAHGVTSLILAGSSIRRDSPAMLPSAALCSARIPA
jgi:hypothetical protein